MRPIIWKGDHAELIDQTLLPHQQVWLTCRSLDEYASAIRDMKIRGAPAIGITAAYGLAGVALADPGLETLKQAGRTLAATRPTAVNLFWAIDRMIAKAITVSEENRANTLVAEAILIHQEDEAMCQAMGDFGAAVVPQGARVLTHCNAGALATGDYGTALGVIRSAHRQGKIAWVWVDETRPYLQGARLTAWELMQDSVPCKLICDNMSGHLMQRGMVDFVVVGADRITANGDVANKIGTYTVAVLCKEHNIPFYVAAPSSTVDLTLENGLQIPIEERAPDELRKLAGIPVAPHDVPVFNPGFDMTPARYISGIITEKGILRAPYHQSLAQLLGAAAVG